MSKGSYKKRVHGFAKRVDQFARHEKLTIIPAPNRVLIRITKQQIEDLISKVITKDDGTTAKLFFEPIHFDQGYDRKFQQNVSVGEAIGVGSKVEGIEVGDTLILDYLTSNLTDHMIGYFKGDQIISVVANTTYHSTSSVLINGRRAWAEGDFDTISMILGVVRGDKLIPFDPYVFMEYKADYLKILSPRGEAMREDNPVVDREVIASFDGCPYRCGDKILLKKDDWFDREIAGRRIAVCFTSDILCKK